jgi:hypothetical protein
MLFGKRSETAYDVQKVENQHTTEDCSQHMSYIQIQYTLMYHPSPSKTMCMCDSAS